MRTTSLESHSEYRFDQFGTFELLQIPVPDRDWRSPPGRESYEEFRGLQGRRPGHSRLSESRLRI